MRKFDKGVRDGLKIVLQEILCCRIGDNAMGEALTLSVPEAGKRYFGLSRNGSYIAAARGDLPTVRIGRKLLVPIRALERMLDHAGQKPAALNRVGN